MRRFDAIDNKLECLTEQIEELSENMPMDAGAADQVTGTSRKLDEILEWIQSQK